MPEGLGSDRICLASKILAGIRRHDAFTGKFVVSPLPVILDGLSGSHRPVDVRFRPVSAGPARSI